MKPKTFNVITLGCAKNTVDSQSMSQLIINSGYQKTDEPSEADVIIVNTCGFIHPAIEESIHELGNLTSNKQNGQTIIAAGCLTQRFGEQVAQQVPGIDGILGTRRWMDIVDVIERLETKRNSKPLYHLPETPTLIEDERGVPRVAIHGTSAYLKIADGCNRPCAFCTIPLIKGPAVSRPLKAILNEARILEEAGVRELILIAQDTTQYGHDLGLRDGLTRLLEQLVDAVPNINWIRLLYTYPGSINDRLIEVMAAHKQILPYLDMPLQHAHPSTLRRMGRPSNIDWVYQTIQKMRTAMPNLALRTTFIVGYPGETEEEFQTLLDFINDICFDRVGAFQYSFELGTKSESLGDPITAQVKQERHDLLMKLQRGISLEKNLSFVGKVLDVLIEGQGDGISLGRTYRDAPEIDGLVILEGSLPIGEMLPIRITGASTYDLSGRLENKYQTIR